MLRGIIIIDRHVTFHNGGVLTHKGRKTIDIDVAYDFGLTCLGNKTDQAGLIDRQCQPSSLSRSGR